MKKSRMQELHKGESHMKELHMKEPHFGEFQMKELRPDQTRTVLEERIAELKEMVSYLTTQNTKLPEGRVHVTASRGNFQYRLYQPDSGAKIYLSKSDFKQIQNYLQREYNEKMIERLQQQIEAFEKCLKAHISVENIYDKFCPAKQCMVQPIYLPDELFVKRWKEIPYAGKGFDASDTSEYYTDLGERVRSKTEILIANHLLKHNIPYKYECPQKLWDGRVVYPDFTCLDIRNRREILWEHFGKMGDSEYVEKNLRKIDNYAKTGYVFGVNLVATFESLDKTLNVRVLDQMIESVFS